MVMPCEINIKLSIILVRYITTLTLTSIRSLNETDWSVQIADMIVTNEWVCPNCEGTFFINGIQRLQHKKGKNHRINI